MSFSLSLNTWLHSFLLLHDNFPFPLLPLHSSPASSLGKGIISASLAKLLQSRGYKVTIQKLDPYLNVDPGTLNPYEHGECYGTEGK